MLTHVFIVFVAEFHSVTKVRHTSLCSDPEKSIGAKTVFSPVNVVITTDKQQQIQLFNTTDTSNNEKATDTHTASNQSEALGNMEYPKISQVSCQASAQSTYHAAQSVSVSGPTLASTCLHRESSPVSDITASSYNQPTENLDTGEDNSIHYDDSNSLQPEYTEANPTLRHQYLSLYSESISESILHSVYNELRRQFQGQVSLVASGAVTKAGDAVNGSGIPVSLYLLLLGALIVETWQFHLYTYSVLNYFIHCLQFWNSCYHFNNFNGCMN